MARLVIYDRTTKEIVHSQGEAEGNKLTLDLADRIMQRKELSVDDYAALLVDETIDCSVMPSMKVNDSGSGVEQKEEDLLEFKEKALKKISDDYDKTCKGKDPVTGRGIYVDCLVGETTYRMNAGRNATETFESGLTLAERNGESQTFIVDFYDDVFAGVAVADAQEVNRLQGNDSRVHYQEKQAFRAAISAAATVQEVKNTSALAVFSVNIES